MTALERRIQTLETALKNDLAYQAAKRRLESAVTGMLSDKRLLGYARPSTQCEYGDAARELFALAAPYRKRIGKKHHFAIFGF